MAAQLAGGPAEPEPSQSCPRRAQRGTHTGSLCTLTKRYTRVTKQGTRTGLSHQRGLSALRPPAPPGSWGGRLGSSWWPMRPAAYLSIYSTRGHATQPFTESLGRKSPLRPSSPTTARSTTEPCPQVPHLHRLLPSQQPPSPTSLLLGDAEAHRDLRP